MNPSLVPISCGTALALMCGAAIAHWSSVRDMEALAARLPAGVPPLPVAEPLPDDGLAREAKGFLAAARRENPKSGGEAPAAAASGNHDPRFERFLTLMEGMLGQNEELRDRIADTNRDLLELRFQVDSYDGQFRPLQIEEEPGYYYDDGSAGVLPPLETP